MKRVRLWLVLAGLLASAGAAQAADPSALWKIVSGKCVPNEQAQHDPAPCAVVDIAGGVDKGWVALKDIRGIAQFLIIPTARIPGIEDPAVLAPGATNYFDAAWRERTLVEDRLHTTVPRDEMSLAINAPGGRSQDQLHIHIDCINPDVRTAVAANLGKVTTSWTDFPVPLAGHPYRAIRIDHATLADTDPFHVLADKDPQAAAEMGKHTLVVVGATFPDGTDGFVLLDGHSNPAAGNFASGEELQDHDCKVINQK